MSVVPHGSILSSPMSLEQPQRLHKGDNSERSKHGNSMLENPSTSSVTALCNPMYMHGHGTGGHGIILSGENDCKDPNNRRSIATDEVPIERLAKVAGAKAENQFTRRMLNMLWSSRIEIQSKLKVEMNTLSMTGHATLKLLLR